MPKFLLSCIVFISSHAYSQGSYKPPQLYKVNDSMALQYPKPKAFNFILQVPKDFVQMHVVLQNKKSVKPLLITIAATGVLLLTDTKIADGVRSGAAKLNIEPKEKNVNLWVANIAGRPTTLLKAPGNINTAFYQLGQGFPGLLLSAGLFTYGKIKNDYRSRSVASQITETFLLTGLYTQILKRITGREVPSRATVKGGKWQPFPSFKNYRDNTPKYDAFPSGHLTTLMSTVSVLALNYPNSKLIKPIGYSLVGLVGLSMINNEVHWASDYPLAIGIGYLCAKQVANVNRKLVTNNKSALRVTPTFTVINNRIVPSILYNF